MILLILDGDFEMTRMISVDARLSQLGEIGGLNFVCWPNGYSGSHSMVTVSCEIDGYVWTTPIREICDRGRRCPRCSGLARVTPDEMIGRLSGIDGVEFIGWHGGEYKNSKTKAIVRCTTDGTEWSSVVLDLQNGHGCPTCAILRRSSKRASNQYDVENRIREFGINFKEWVKGSYKNNRSKLVASCIYHGDWITSSESVFAGRGCPSCSVTGLSRTETTYLYALVSDGGGMVKVGVTNNARKRIRSLKKCTPFQFDVVGIVSFSDGYIAEAEERRFHKSMVSANMSGFNGCTEWFLFDGYASHVLSEIRNMNGA